MKLPDGRTKRELVPREHWHALILDAIPGAWDAFERIEIRPRQQAEQAPYEAAMPFPLATCLISIQTSLRTRNLLALAVPRTVPRDRNVYLLFSKYRSRMPSSRFRSFA